MVVLSRAPRPSGSAAPSGVTASSFGAQRLVSPMETCTLTPHITEYLRGRVARGELTRQSAVDIGYCLGGFARSFGRRPITALGPRAVDRWLETTGTYAPATRREYLARIRCFLRWMIAERHLSADPTRHVQRIVQPRTVPVTFSEGDVAVLLASAPDRRAPLFRSYHDDRSRLSAKSISDMQRKWMRRAGVKVASRDGRSAHGLRRTAGSDVMERVHDVRVVQEMLGHAHVETTAKYYLRPVPLGQLRDAMEGRDYLAAA